MEPWPMLKNCNICRRDLPLEHFRRVRKGSDQRDGRCNRCFNAQRQTLRLAKRSQHLRTFLSKVAAAKSEKLAADLAAEAIRQFGGVQALAGEIYERSEERRVGKGCRCRRSADHKSKEAGDRA